MTALQEAVDDFLAQENIAVTGESLTKEDAANIIFRRLMETGHRVFRLTPMLSALTTNHVMRI